MAIDADRLREFLNAGGEAQVPAAELADCIAAAKDLLDGYTDTVDEDDPIPDRIFDRAHLLVAAELFHIGNSPNGYVNQQFDDGSTAPVRVSTDALRPARSLLSQWVSPVTFA